MPRWSNTERLVVGWLTTHQGLPVYTERPEGLTADHLLIERIGGARTDPIDREVDVEVTVTTTARGDLWDAVADVEEAIAALAAAGSAAGYVDDVVERFAFAAEEHRNPGVRKARAVFTLTVRPE